MDYLTKPTSREELRSIAKYIRSYFKCKNKYRFDVISAFEQMHSKFSQVVTVVVEDDSFEDGIPARCIPDFDGGYVIEVKQSIYDGAVKGIGGYRAHILHEMCHVILCIIGFKPILERLFKNNEITAFCSMEWQAKALCGEILMPYEATEGLSIRQIRFNCKVSTASAKLRYNNYNTGGDYEKKNKEKS